MQALRGAYAHKVGKRIDRALDFHACAEARTKDFYQANTAWGEPAQLDRVGSSTGLVTFSIGGNDAGFRKTLTDCIGGARIFPFVTCSGDKKITDPVDAALDALRGKSTQEGIHSYDAIMAGIRSRAPKAAVVAVGYPHMFPVKGGEGGLIPGRCEGVKKVDQRWIAAKTDEVNAALKASALRHGYLFATRPAHSTAMSCAAPRDRGSTASSRTAASIRSPTGTPQPPTPS